MGTKRNVDMSSTQDTVKIVKSNQKSLTQDDQLSQNQVVDNLRTEDKSADNQASGEDKADQKTAKTAKKKFVRSHRYTAKRSLVDRTREYDAFAAVELVKKTSYSKFVGTITADLVCREAGDQGNVTLPHSTGKVMRVAIASDELIAQLEKGVIDFDILLSTPAFVPKLARHAKQLGPKGLMPNPKNGTITAQPEKRQKELAGGAIQIRTDRKFPVGHVVIGKTSMDTKDLVANINALTTALRDKLVKLTVSATMSPGIKIKVEKKTQV